MKPVFSLRFNVFFPISANFPESVVDNLPADISTGIYYGWARVDNGDIHKMVMSIGWNPYYKNTKKSMVRPCLYLVCKHLQAIELISLHQMVWFNSGIVDLYVLCLILSFCLTGNTCDPHLWGGFLRSDIECGHGRLRPPWKRIQFTW